MVTTVAVIGSTGSIGTQTLDVVRAEPGAYEIDVLAAGSSIDALAEQAAEVRPKVVALSDDSKAAALAERLPAGTELVTGPDALAQVSGASDVVVNGVVGFAGLPVTVEALRNGKRLALANKESLIAAGPVVRAEMAPGAEIVPVDSEHCAIHQCLRSGDLPGGGRAELRRLLLTASGGPFRGRSRAELAEVTVEQALAHPTWAMGPKITVDSSTLMNKGLEVIEAIELFGVGPDAVDVVVHPQSIVHSMVEFTDGAVIAQLSLPDMRLPIGYALAYPDRIGTPFGAIDWAELSRLDFEPPDRATFGCLDLAFEAARAGDGAPTWLNAANEVVVDAFLDGRIRWTEIADSLKAVLERHDGTPMGSLDVVIDIDRRARLAAEAEVGRRSGRM
ncbi:MAG: 1-deoxy-D-xylulose-5-phosphate reductoisomerase [Actinomycetota bacterium]